MKRAPLKKWVLFYDVVIEDIRTILTACRKAQKLGLHYGVTVNLITSQLGRRMYSNDIIVFGACKDFLHFDPLPGSMGPQLEGLRDGSSHPKFERVLEQGFRLEQKLEDFVKYRHTLRDIGSIGAEVTSDFVANFQVQADACEEIGLRIKAGTYRYLAQLVNDGALSKAVHYMEMI